MVSLKLLDSYSFYKNKKVASMQTLLLKHFLLLVLLASQTVVMADEAPKKQPLLLLLLGAPGSGRDALAVKASSAFHLPYISTADLLLDYSDDESDTGRLTRECLNTGRIPDDLLLRLISERIKKSDCANGFLLDGFPKTCEQAKALKVRFSQQYRMLPAYIKTSDKWLITFHEGRLVCTNCGRVYHQDRSPPQNEHECDLCGYELIQRSDDCAETLKKRTEVYRDTILPLLDYYKSEKMLIEIDGDRPFDEMFQDVKLLVNTR
jgi:adenylate kinase